MMKDGKYINTCLECDYVWETSDEYNPPYDYCPKCHQGDIVQELNDEYTPQNDFKGSNLNKKDEIV